MSLDKDENTIKAYRFSVPLKDFTEQEHKWVSSIVFHPEYATLRDLCMVWEEGVKDFLRDKHNITGKAGLEIGQFRENPYTLLGYSPNAPPWVIRSPETGGNPYNLARVLYGLVRKFRPEETYAFEYIRLDDSLVYVGGGGAYKITAEGVKHIDTLEWLKEV